MSGLSDTFGKFFGPQEECVYCGGTDGDLVVGVRDDDGNPTHWHHEACEAEADAERKAEVEQADRDRQWFLNHPSA